MDEYVITGTLSSMTRLAAFELIRNNGDMPKDYITHGTSYLVVGTATYFPTRKLVIAERYHVPIINEAEFLTRMKANVQLSWDDMSRFFDCRFNIFEPK